ncbi:hypothetical protein [Salinactinospora qingdaonensis]|uniref:Uncharacterized protein n=1 Tax=Salinactinospora qingdaonensis TaxID=702744 RepID=A0ABP7F0T1_9ACTN
MTSARPRSVSTVALLADIPGTGHLGDAQAWRFGMRGDDLTQEWGDFVDFSRGQMAAGRKIVALYPKWQSEAAWRAIQFARGTLRTDHIAAVGVDLAPLTISLLADQLAYLSPYLPAGMVAALAEELPKHMVGGAWLRRVSNLETLPTSVRQHMGSYAPGVSFLAFCAPVPRVGRLRKGDVAANLPARPTDPVQMLWAAPAEVDTSAFESLVSPSLRPVAVRALSEQPLGTTYWGSTKYVEFVAFSAHPQALTYVVNSIRPTSCAWCSEQVTATYCPFCGAVNSTPVGRPPSYSRARDLPPSPATLSAATAAKAESHPGSSPSPPPPHEGPSNENSAPEAPTPPPRRGPLGGGASPPNSLPMAPNGHPAQQPLNPSSRPAPPRNGKV